VSILNPNLVRRVLEIPEHITLVAYLCLGYVEAFAAEPDLERAGWEKRTPLTSVLSLDRYDTSWDERETTL
jgi:5,6-dimethylbenzimidazole synthase